VIRKALIYGTILIVSATLCWFIAGREAFLDSAAQAGQDTLEIVPRILLGVLIAGMVAVLLPLGLVARWLGQSAGFRGLLLATAIGTILPGGPTTAFPLIVALFSAGAEVGALIALMTSWGIVSLQRMLIWELPFLGPEFAITRYLICLPLPVLAGWLARRLSSHFAGLRPRLPGHD